MSNPSQKAQIATLIDAEVARGMAPYLALGLPANVLDELERTLRFALRTHPTAQHLLRRLVDEPVMVKSDEVDTSGVDVPAKKGQGA